MANMSPETKSILTFSDFDDWDVRSLWESKKKHETIKYNDLEKRCMYDLSTQFKKC